MDQKYQNLPYRPCVGIMLINPSKLIFAGRRIDGVKAAPDAWQMPQGGIDPGEEAERAAYRELEEETGISQAKILAAADNWLTYDLPQELLGKTWGGKYRGQKQKWFAMQFEGADSDINIKTPHPEFDRWAWKPAEEILEAIVPFKRDLYADVFSAFEALLR